MILDEKEKKKRIEKNQTLVFFCARSKQKIQLVARFLETMRDRAARWEGGGGSVARSAKTA